MLVTYQSPGLSFVVLQKSAISFTTQPPPSLPLPLEGTLATLIPNPCGVGSTLIARRYWGGRGASNKCREGLRGKKRMEEMYTNKIQCHCYVHKITSLIRSLMMVFGCIILKLKEGTLLNVS